jgi:hypothetical protein
MPDNYRLIHNAEEMMENSVYTNPQRTKNYWEPVFGSYSGPLEVCDADFDTVTGVQKVRVSLERYGTRTIFEGLRFSDVDFSGEFDGGARKATFKDCFFERCSFRGSEIKNTKFTNCKFLCTSFSLASFSDCEFRDCLYEKIGFSGNTTRFQNVYIDAGKFLKAAYLQRNTSVLRENKTNLLHQSYRLEKTKSVLARKLLSMRPVKDDVDMYTRGIKTARWYEITSKIKESVHFVVLGPVKNKLQRIINLICYSVELVVVLFFGWLSGWGQKIGKAVFFGVVTIVAYGFLYSQFLTNEVSSGEAFLRSFEYMLLFGYTKYPLKDLDAKTQWIVFSNSALGMVWFAALIPSIINKMGPQDDQ